MAIIISEEKKQFNWLPFLIAAVLLFVALVGAYLLFFTEAPLIEKIVPSNQKIISDISSVNGNDFKNDINFAKNELKSKVNQAMPSVTGGTASTTQGRLNPFLPF